MHEGFGLINAASSAPLIFHGKEYFDAMRADRSG